MQYFPDNLQKMNIRVKPSTRLSKEKTTSRPATRAHGIKLVFSLVSNKTFNFFSRNQFHISISNFVYKVSKTLYT